MRRWLRPVLLTGLVSFLLGMWFSLQKAENHILGHLKTLPKIKLLTDQPNWWRDVAARAARSGIVELEIISPPRHQWESVIRATEHGCHAVALRSFFENFFVNNDILAPFPGELKTHLDQVHADFRAKESQDEIYFLPLAWSVSRWRAEPGQTNKDARFCIKTSPDEALMIAYDMNLVGGPESSEELDFDWTAIAEAAWTKFSAKAFFDLTGAETSVPRFPVKGSQEYVESEELGSLPLDFPAGSASNLWTYGLSLCRTPTKTQALSRFFTWLMAPEQMALLLRASALKGALQSLEQPGIPVEQRPSALRKFSLSKMRQPELEWPMAAAWYELIMSEK